MIRRISPTMRDEPEKMLQRRKMDLDVERFLAAGGKIESVEQGKSGEILNQGHQRSLNNLSKKTRK